MVIKNEKLRSFLKIALPCFFIPVTVFSCAVLFREKFTSYVIIATVILTLIYFYAGFEKKKTGTRRLVLSAVLIAVSVAGRLIFSFIPGVNPITAIAVLTAVYMGSETGFLIGSLSALISNIFGGQGLWTPFQMFAWGMTGFLAGALSKFLAGHKIRLCIFNFFGGIIFSFIMDIWTVIWFNDTFSLELYIAAIASAVPFTAVYAVSNVIFTLLTEKTFRERLTRLKKKYEI